MRELIFTGRNFQETSGGNMRLARCLVRVAPVTFVVVLGGTGLLVAVNVLGILLVQPVLEMVSVARTSNSPVVFWRPVVALVLVFFLAPLIGSIMRIAIGNISDRLFAEYYRRFSAAALRGETGDFWLENPALGSMGRNVTDRLRDWMLPASLEALWDVLVMRLSALPMVVVVASWNWMVALVLTGPLLLASVYHARLMEVTLRAARSEGREADIATYFYR